MSFEGQQIQASWDALLPAQTVTVGPGVELDNVVGGIYDFDLSANRIDILQVRDSSVGFTAFNLPPLTFTDITGRVPAIVGLSITETITDVNFTPGDVTFDADNIFVDLNSVEVLFGESITLDVTFNGVPTTTADSYTSAEDTVLTVAAADGVLKNDDDPDGDPLNVALGTGPSNGTLDLQEDGSFTYTPNADFNGQDSFTYTASDGLDTTDPVTVTLNVTPVNEPPVANDDTAVTALLTPVAIPVLANDTDPDGTLETASVTVADGPANGTATANPDGTVTYLPDFLFIGEDTFTYTVADDQGDASNAATVDVTVGGELNPIDGQGTIAGTSSADAITAGTGFLGRGATVFAQGGDDIVLGSAGNDSVFAGAGNDLVFGDRGSDRLFGDAGNDILVGGPGNDSLYGGPGLDTAVFAGLFADHRITGFGTQSRTVEDRAGNGGRDSLNLVELLQFDDGVFDARNGSFTPNAFATAAVEQLVTSPGFTTTPDGFATSPSTTQVESLVVQGDVA
jgi:Ca2+-binding RTX toxin-like protein